MAQYTIQLQQTNIIYDSEKVTIPGGYGTLTRGHHYTMDFVNGIITIILDALTMYPLLSLQNMSIEYKYQVDFSQHYTLESHIPVYNELATVIETWKLKVVNSPIATVSRVYNVTTKETYVVESISNDIIEISGYTAPATTVLTQQLTNVRNSEFSGKQMLLTVPVPYMSGYNVNEHLLVSVDRIYATTKAIRLIEGGRTAYQSNWSMIVEPETYDIDIYTGSTILRRAKVALLVTTDYTYTISNGVLSILFTTSGQTKIGSNSVYLILHKSYVPLDFVLYDNTEYRINYIYDARAENITFTTRIHTLSKLFSYVQASQLYDDLLTSPVFVMNANGDLYIETQDYVINYQQRQIIYLTTGNITSGETVIVYYRDAEDVYMDFTYLSDTVVVDYEWGANVLNWTINTTDTTYVQDMDCGVLHERQIVKLDYYPASWQDIIIYEKGDVTKTKVGRVVDYRQSSNDVFIKEIVKKGSYVLEYAVCNQLITPNTVYYVSYKYGARRDALVDNFARLMGIVNFTIIRKETYNFTTLQSTVTLNYSPVDRNTIIIYKEDDTTKTAITMATDYNESTQTITFNPIGIAGTYIVEYKSVGYDTDTIRKAVKGMTAAVQEGPTVQGLKNLIAAFTSEEPTITLMSDEGTILGSEDSTIKGSRLSPLVSESSSVQADGTPSIVYLPSRFNTGLSVQAQNNAWVRISGENNLSMTEGTIELLIGNFFDGNDEQIHYFVDAVGTDKYTNRLALYKNSQGRLCFEIFDKDSQLYRSTMDVTRIVTAESYTLQKGDSQVVLQAMPAYTSIDINENEQSDVFEADQSKFLIYPVYTDEQKLLPLYVTIEVLIGINSDYTTLSGYTGVVNKLNRLATIVESHGGRLSIYTELEFMQGCVVHGNILRTLKQQGHSVGVYVDIPTDLLHEEDRKLYVQQRKTYCETLMECSIAAIASGTQINNTVDELSVMGFNVISEYIDPYTLEPIKFEPYVYRPDSQDFTQEDKNGNIVYVPGVSHWGWNRHPITAQSMNEIELSLRTSLNKKVSSRVNSWYLPIHIADLDKTNWNTELNLLDGLFTSVVDPLVSTEQVEWKTIQDIYEKFLFWELWYNEAGFRDIRQSILTAKTFNRHTMTLTFEPAKESGTYMFDFIAGWSKYEETEHFVSISFKLHTEDGLAPFYKLFVDGKLSNNIRFSDL